MVKGGNRSGSDKSKRDAALLAKGKPPKDRGGKNLGVGSEHSRIAKGNRTQQGPMKQR